jgi:predicted nucleic acid-binding protein
MLLGRENVTVIRTHYLDASALVKLFIDEIGSAAVRSYLEPHATRITTALCFAETLGVLKAKHVHKHLTMEEYLSACEDMMGCLRGQTLTIEDIGITERVVFDEVERLAKAHALDLSDACQLLTLRRGALSSLEGDSRPILITADKKLAAAARSEGLRVWDCMNEPAP